MAEGFICRGGGARITTGSYVGGGENSFTIDCGFVPKFLCINYKEGMLATSIHSGATVKSYHVNGVNTGHDYCTISVSENTVTVAQVTNYLNQTAFTYYYTAIG